MVRRVANIEVCSQDDLSNDIESLLEEVKIVQANLSDLPDESLDAMEEGLREGISILGKCEEAANLLEQKIMEFREESEVQVLLRELAAIRTRIVKLLVQARQGLNTIQDAKVEVVKKGKELEEQKAKVAKLDLWLEAINDELKESTQQSDVFTEEDIMRFIEIYERYIKEYEEYEILLNSIIVIIRGDSSHIKAKLDNTKKSLEETRNLVINEIERLRQILIHIRIATEVVEDDISQTDRTIDSTSMPEEIVTPRDVEHVPDDPVTKEILVKKVGSASISNDESVPVIQEPVQENVKSGRMSKQETELSQLSMQIQEAVIEKKEFNLASIETQTGKSLISDAPTFVDKSVICVPVEKLTHDVSITCAPPKEVEVQTSEPKSSEREILENIQVKQTISDGHETIEIASRPVTRDQKTNEQSLLVDAHYINDKVHKDSELNIVHSLPQSFETVMVEPDETTTEVVVDADGTKRIIVKKVRKTLVTRQQLVQSHQHESHILSSGNLPQHSFSQLTLKDDTGSSSSLLEEGGKRHVHYQVYDGQIISGLPGREVTIQEVTSRPDIIIAMNQGMKPEEILQLAEGEMQPQIHTSSSVTAVVQQVTKRIVKTRRRIIRRVVIIDGKEQVTEEIVDDPDEVEVFEEMIPRVSINVKENETGPASTNDPNDNDKPSRHESPETDKHNDNKDKSDDSKPENLEVTDRSEKNIISEVGNQCQSKGNTPASNKDLQGLVKEFVKIESEKYNVDFPEDQISLTESSFTLPGNVTQQNSSDGQITYITSGIHSTETSSNTATVIQKITKTVRRMRKRIIRHVQIVDGKEHVTEEIIEEPEDIQVVEDEPTISHSYVPDVSTKRIKIIRQVCIIDGKEHVTEQIVEDPNDDYPETTETVYDDKPDITEIEEIEVVPSKHGETIKFQEDVIKQLRGSKLNQSETSQIQPSKQEVKDTKEEPILKHMENEKGYVIEMIEEPLQEPKSSSSTKSLSEKDSKFPGIVDDSKSQTFIDTEKTQLSQTIKREGSSSIDQTPDLSTPQDNIIQVVDPKDGVVDYLLKFPEATHTKEADGVENVITKCIRKKKRIIKHIQIIDGKEHVTEEVIDEPDEVEIFESEPKDYSHILQEQGVKTKRVKVIRQVHIIDGKEHIREQVIEDQDDEYIPDTTVLADIRVQMEKPDVEDIRKVLSTEITVAADREPVESADCRLDQLTVTKQLFQSILESTDSLNTIKIDDDKLQQKLDTKKEDTSVIVEEKPLSNLTQSFLENEIENSKQYSTSSKEIVKAQSNNLIPEKQIENEKINEVGKINQVTVDTKSIKEIETIAKQKQSEKSDPSDDHNKFYRPDYITKIIQEMKPEEQPQSNIIMTEESSVDIPLKWKSDVFGSDEAVEELPHVTEFTETVKSLNEPERQQKSNIESNISAEISLKPDAQEATLQTKVTESSQIILSPSYETVMICEKEPQSNLSTFEQTGVIPPDVTNIFTEKEGQTIVKTRKRIVKHIQIIDGKEHVTEEVIDEPDEVEIFESEPKDYSHILQEQGVKTKRVKVIRQVHIIDGKEHIREQVIEDQDDEYIPDTTVIADIKVQFEKPEILKVQKGSMSSEMTVVSDREAVQCTHDAPKDLMLSEIEHSLSTNLPIQSIIENTESAIMKQSIDDKLDAKTLDFYKLPIESAASLVVQQKPLGNLTQSFLESEIEHSKQLITKSKEAIDYEEIPTIIKTPVLSTDNRKSGVEIKLGTEYVITEKEEELQKDIDITPESKRTILNVKDDIPKITQDLCDVEDLRNILTEEILTSPISPKAESELCKPVTTFADIKKDVDANDTKSIKEPVFTENELLKQGFVANEVNRHVLDANDYVSEINQEMPNVEAQSILKRNEETLIDTVTLKVKSEIHESDSSGDDVSKFTEFGKIVQSQFEPETVERETLTKISLIPDSQKTEVTTNVLESKKITPSPKDDIVTIAKTELPMNLTLHEKNVITPVDPTVNTLTQKDKKIITKKEHVTKQIIEKPSQEFVPETSETAVIDSPLEGVEITEIVSVEDKSPVVLTEKVEGNLNNIGKSIVSLTKDLIEKEIIYPEHVITKEVKSIHIGTIITESDANVESKEPEISYIQQFETVEHESSKKSLPDEDVVLSKTMHSDTTPSGVLSVSEKSDTKHDVNLFIQTERLDTHLNDTHPSTGIDNKSSQTLDPEQKDKPELDCHLDKISQTVDISMSIIKTDKNQSPEPKIELDLKIEEFHTSMPSVVKKDIVANLPAQVDIVEEHFNESEVIEEKEKDHVQRITEKSRKEHKKRSKKKQAQPLVAASKPLKSESLSETDKSIIDTESSSLDHYVELSSTTPNESPKPSDDLLLISEDIKATDDTMSPSMESEQITEKGYEPEDLSAGKDHIIDERQKKHKKRKAYAVSEDTAYPKQTTTEEETTISTPLEMSGPIQQRKIKTKKGKKKTPVEGHQPIDVPEYVTKPDSPKVGNEILTSSPRDESYHTFSETSDVNTVKIVEECVGSSPEIIQREVGTTVTYTVPVVEEIATTEYSVQTSPVVFESEKEEVEIPKAETTDSELQTSPTPVSEILIQTVPIEDKEVHTQTLDDIIIVEKVEVLDSQIQTSRSETPEKIFKSEVTTQVGPRDIGSPDNKFSQTSSPIVEKDKEIIETDNREMQTSPLPQVQKDEKSTEIIIETADSDIQTIKYEIVDQETSTTPNEVKEVIEMSIQTPEISVVHSFTQVDLQLPEIDQTNVKEQKVVMTDNTQQTSPRVEDEQKPVEYITTQEVSKTDNFQQTSPRVEWVTPRSRSPLEDFKEITTFDISQQTTPREIFEVPITSDLKETIVKAISTVNTTQQTSPRIYSEDSISTSTDEPYEVHLRAQISIPQLSDDFIENERQSQLAQSILGDSYKQKKRKQKRKAESPLQSPGSLSDPINAELSMSVTPSSEDLSSKDVSSIDEGISHLVSPIHSVPREIYIASKPTYSDVVQRSKSKSPSPSKTILTKSTKTEKEKLLDILEKRTQSINDPQKNSDDSMTVALIDPTVEKSYELVVNKELVELRNAINSHEPLKVEKSVVIIIETISTWLEEIQYKIKRDVITGQTSSADSIRIKELENYVQRLKETIYITEVNEEIITLIETLSRQVHAVHTLSNQKSLRLDEEEKKWNKLLSDVERLNQSVHKVKFKLDDLIMSESTTQMKLDDLDNIENDNNNNIDAVKKTFRFYRNLVELNPKLECPATLFVCDDDTKQIENTINAERDRLLQLSSLAEEYEQTLQDFGQITDVAEALLDGKIIVSNLDHLHEEIQKHRKFFVNLSHCRAILESLEDNLDNETRAKYSGMHHSLHDRATTIIDRAASRAQQMTLAASRWSSLDQGMKQEQQWLIVAQQRIPDLSNVTSIDHEQYINLYQSISLDVSHHYAKMLRLMSITEGLQGLIVCSGLESECSVALDTLLKLQEDIDSRLTRLNAFKENWMTYDHLIDRIECWMKLANTELEHITPENITTTSNLRRFWELKAQHDVHNSLKNESGIQFEKALEILPISDEMVQRQFFSKIDDKWRDLSIKISNIHATAIQNISDRDVSSGEKLNILEDEMSELRAILDGLKGVIKSEDELNLYIERLQVMTGRIDRIQNELGRLSLLPTAETERLGELLTQSSLLDDQIAEELERSLLLKEKIVQVQGGIVRCQKNQRRAQQTLEECEAAERHESDVVERASQNCEKLIEELSSQWKDILALRQALHTLPTSLRVCMSPLSVEREISALQESHSALESTCNDLSARLRARLTLWRRFERQLELLQGAVREADYMVELLTVQGQVDYDRLLKATEKLETLSDSLSQRNGELVGSLREAARPLQSSVEDSVAQRLNKELDDAAAAYDSTCANLTQLCDKYHKAVELWRRYRSAAAGVRAATELHEAALHALRPDDAPAAHQACLEQEARVAELRSLAARVAAETGSRALQADADALARRLQLVAGAVQALADLGEARQLARAKAQQAKEMFCDMKQDLAPLHEDGEIVEDKLIALRDNLIALGKSEADIAPAKAELPDIDRGVSDEHSIVRILELWQAMFRDTFLHYHRLSTALVRSGDAATALRLWHEYLLDLQSFLSGTVPADYENLTEHRRLCRVHRNLLASQRSVLINENRETKNRDLADKFDTLTNLHNETLARIVERHDEVCTRIATWDDYREINTELLRWLKEIEREKEKLQLRYVHIKRIQKILSKIQNLSDRLPEGRTLSDKLLGNLKKVLDFTEDTYAASVRIEYAGVVKRVDNLQASLDTWRDFLTRILSLINDYEHLTGDLVKLYTKTQTEIMSYSDEDRLSRPQLRKAIDKYSDLRTKIDKTETQIEALSVIQEQLKECLSPQDIRIVNQKVWQLRQQRADLEHQLSIIIHRLQERLEVYTIFDSRLSRFSEWITTIESRLETTTSTNDFGALDPQDLIRRINSDIQAEIALKEREFEWLTETGSALVDLSKKDEKSYSKNTSKHLRDVQERWHKLQETGRSRIAKINELLETISQLEERLTEIRLRLHTIESNLSASVVLEHLTTKAVDSKFQERDDIHKNIEDESGKVGQTLNLCELVFNDPDVNKGNFDLRNLHTGVDIVEKKWKNICDMSERRKKSLKEVRKSAELSTSLLPKVEKKLDGIEKRVEKIEARKRRGEELDESVSKCLIKDLDVLEGDTTKLEVAYGRVASARGVETRGAGAEDAARLLRAGRRGRALRERVLSADEDAHARFVAAHGRAVVALAETDVRLTKALHLSPAPSDTGATLRELEGVETELRECEALVEEADRLAVAVSSAAGVADMAAEYHALYEDVRARLGMARAGVVGDVDSAVQVDTLRWETDAALQVDTLTSKETYRVELEVAVGETSDSLEALRTALLLELTENATGEELADAAKEIARAGSKPEQTLELAKHLSELLLTECDASEEEAMLKEVESLSLRYEDLLTQAKKRELQIQNLRLPHSASYALTCEHESGRLTCPLCSERNWRQLDNDLWRLEQWLQFAEATDEARADPPRPYDALEDAIQDHREFLLDLDSHKALVVSLNVVGAHVTRHARAERDAAATQARLAAASARWDAACRAAAAWQARLQDALMHNDEFHDNVVELVARLGAAERTVRAREPLRLARPADELRQDFRSFSELRDELSRAEPRVLALRDAAQLLQRDAKDVCRKLGELRLRLQSLRKLSGVYALKLGAALARAPGAPHTTHVIVAAAASAQLLEPELEPAEPEDHGPAPSAAHEAAALGGVRRGLRFVLRVARASLPFQALLLLLGAAALAPLAPSDCRAGPSLAPVLRFPHGPPPV